MGHTILANRSFNSLLRHGVLAVAKRGPVLSLLMAAAWLNCEPDKKIWLTVNFSLGLCVLPAQASWKADFEIAVSGQIRMKFPS